MRATVTVKPDRSLSAARALAVLTPTALLGGALGFQYIGGLSPCEMCMWQRWPHLAAILLSLGAIAISLQWRSRQSALLTLLAGLAILTSGLIGGFHAGVEYHWWQGLTTCTQAPVAGGGRSALEAIMAAPLIRCDTAPWSLFGISMAGYNFLLSTAAAFGVFALLLRWRMGK